MTTFRMIKKTTDNFNYIAFGSRERVQATNEPVVMNRGRMFEYTPSDLSSALENLETDSTQFLEKLPTFLCSEVSRSGAEASMLIKYGRISNISVDRREVRADFEVLVDFGELTFDSLDDAMRVFEADAFQLFRTHWAVRTGDVESILTALERLKPESGNDIASLAEPLQSPDAERPSYVKKTVGTAGSVETFLKILERWSPGENTETFFRGHEDPNFQLTPSLLRKSADGSWQFLPREDRLCKELLIAHFDEFQSDQYCFDRLVRMQHYSLPTRLLDISSNPLVALFFACSGDPELSKKSGEVIIFRILSDAIKYYDSDTVSCISNLSKLSYLQKNEIDLNQDSKQFNTTDVAKKLLHLIREEKAFFEPNINPQHLGSIICVKAKRTNIRIKSQMGAFLLFGHEIALPEDGQDGIEIARIKIINKREILKQLDAININAKTVYPSISETAVHLRTQYRESARPA